jgi:twitching motility two-component system response regulator PilG
MSAAAETYLVACSACRSTFDALEATWCSCVATERTLVCPSCLACFCKAPPQYKQAFWRGAPKSLWDRKLEEHTGTFELPPNPSPEAVSRPLVLLVDDEKDIQRVASRAILGLGYGLVVARNGQEGLELAGRYKPDLVLSDALMPQMDGREMCRRIKENPETAKTRTIVMTALYTAMKYRLEAQRAYRVDDYLTKPLDFAVLRDLLQKFLG